MTPPTKDADKMKALEALEDIAANWLFDGALETKEMADRFKIIRAALTTPAPQSEKVEVVTVEEFGKILTDFLDRYLTAYQYAELLMNQFQNGLKITKEPNDEQ